MAEGTGQPTHEAADPLAVLFAEAEARAGTPLEALAMDHTQAAFDAYCVISARHGEVEPAARGAMALIVPRVLRDAAAAREAMRDDPAAPGLEDAYRYLLRELGDLATVFVTTNAESHRTPDPYDEHAGAYRTISAEINAFMAAGQAAQPVWGILRRSRAAARGRPPPRRPPQAPLADDREYYTPK